MRLLVGLGNPGKQYAFNRHNIGFLAVDALAAHFRFAPWRTRFQGATAEGEIAGEKIIALKPGTYMNLSGQAVGEAARFFKLTPSDVTVIYDDIELVPGKVKVKMAGGAAGPNGIRSIDEHIGQEYWRVRLGVGRPNAKDQVKGHVLENFAKSDMDWLGELLNAICVAAPLLIKGDENKFMTKIALAMNPPPPKPARKDQEAPTENE